MGVLPKGLGSGAADVCLSRAGELPAGVSLHKVRGALWEMVTRRENVCEIWYEGSPSTGVRSKDGEKCVGT